MLSLLLTLPAITAIAVVAVVVVVVAVQSVAADLAGLQVEAGKHGGSWLVRLRHNLYIQIRGRRGLQHSHRWVFVTPGELSRGALCGS